MELNDQPPEATPIVDESRRRLPSSSESQTREPFSEAQYTATNDRRFQNFSFFWQASALGLAAEAFLFTVAIAHDTSDAGRFIASGLAVIVAFAALALMHTQHGYQLIEGRWMDAIEEAREWKVMGHARGRLERKQVLDDAVMELRHAIGNDQPEPVTGQPFDPHPNKKWHSSGFRG